LAGAKKIKMKITISLGNLQNFQNVIEAAPEGQMLPAAVLSGNIVIETRQYTEKRGIKRDNSRFL